MHDQILEKLVQLSVKVAIRSEKSRKYGIILASPRWISCILFIISMVQLSTIFNPNSELQKLISVIIAVISFINFVVDLLSEKKQKFNEIREHCDNLLIELSYLRTDILNNQIKNSMLRGVFDQLVDYEKEMSKEASSFNFLSDRRTLKSFLRREGNRYDWIKNKK